MIDPIVYRAPSLARDRAASTGWPLRGKRWAKAAPRK